MPRGYCAIALFPFIFIKNTHLRENSILINHERIHLRQQLELLILPFYVLYIFEFIMLILIFRSWNKAYLNISFEKEASANEQKFNYLNDRPFWNFKKYYRTNTRG